MSFKEQFVFCLADYGEKDFKESNTIVFVFYFIDQFLDSINRL